MSLKDIKIKEILGLKVVALKSVDKWHKEKFYKNEKMPINYILFSDRKSFLILNTQNMDVYHDCNEDALEVDFYQDEDQWKDIEEYVDADDFIEFC